jgi:hypothetical protein
VSILEIAVATKLKNEEKRKKLIGDGKPEEAEKVKDAKILLVLDSLAQMSTDKEMKNAKDAHNAADMGSKAKNMKQIFRILTTNYLGLLGYPMIAITHTYGNPSMPYSEKGISGGKALPFAGSTIVEFLTPQKEKTKEGDIVGVILRARMKKARFTRQNKEVEIRLFYTKGLDKYWGLIDFAEEAGMLVKDGKKFVLPNGKRAFRRELEEKPEGYFTEEFLQELDKHTPRFFKYGIQEGTAEDITKEKPKEESPPPKADGLEDMEDILPDDVAADPASV